jgi:hypothetical protein
LRKFQQAKDDKQPNRHDGRHRYPRESAS